MSRQGDRRDLDTEVRVRMAEEDLDRVDSRFNETVEKIEHKANNHSIALQGIDRKFDAIVAELKAENAELRAEMKEGFDKCEARDGSTRKLLTGLLVSIVTLCVTVVVGVLVTLGGG